MADRTCVICGGTFKPIRGSKTCSPVCSAQLEERREQENAERRRHRYHNDKAYRAQEIARASAAHRKQAEHRKVARIGDADARLFAAERAARGLLIHQRKEVAARLLIEDPTPTNARIARATGLSAPLVRGIRSRMERAGTIPAVAVRIDARGALSPAHKDGPSNEFETLARRGVAKAIAAVGALRTVEIALSELAGDPTIATTPYSTIECEYLALHVGSRGA
jgi:hypothetical protein